MARARIVNLLGVLLASALLAACVDAQVRDGGRQGRPPAGHRRGRRL
jgi:hypothetical protein